jgi:hypothetical protein
LALTRYGDWELASEVTAKCGCDTEKPGAEKKERAGSGVGLTEK